MRRSVLGSPNQTLAQVILDGGIDQVGTIEVMSAEEYERTAKVTFTTDEIFEAARMLEEHNVPPMVCKSCGARFYIVPPDAPPPWIVKCDCGEEWLTGGGVGRFPLED